MTQKRLQDKLAKRSSRQYSVFMGSHYGMGKTDQPNEFAYVSDFEFTNKKPWLRAGCRKNQTTGYTTSITSLFSISFADKDLVASVQNGVLTVYPKDDVLDGQRVYYTVREVGAGFTPSTLTAKTVNELIAGRKAE